jgi:hypothetical protein
MNFKQWFESGGGFIYGSMADPATDQNDHPPLGKDLTADPNMSLGGDDLPPTHRKKKKKKKDKENQYQIKFPDFGIRKEVLPNYFI